MLGQLILSQAPPIIYLHSQKNMAPSFTDRQGEELDVCKNINRVSLRRTKNSVNLHAVEG